jgi:hypothetical protein
MLLPRHLGLLGVQADWVVGLFAWNYFEDVLGCLARAWYDNGVFSGTADVKLPEALLACPRWSTWLLDKLYTQDKSYL